MLGTLASAVLTQRAAERTKAREFEEAERRRIDDREFEARQALLAARRNCYIELNTAARYYHTLLRNAYHALLPGPLPDELRSAVDEARIEHRAKHSEAQMVVPDDILAAASKVNRELSRIYGVVLRISDRRAKEGEDMDALNARLNGLWGLLQAMRTVMRVDLGSSAASRPELRAFTEADDAE